MPISESLTLFQLFLQVYFNLRVFKKLQTRPPSQHEELNARRRKCLRLILAVTVIFFILWLPLTVFTLISEYHPQSLKEMMGRYHDVTYGILHLLGAGTSIANPILYGYMNENFRNEYRKFYHKMPWYRSSKLFVKNLKSQMSQKPLTKAPSNSSIESGPVVTQRPKGLRKLKDSQLMMSQLGVSSNHSPSCHSFLIKRENHEESSHSIKSDKCHTHVCDHGTSGYENKLFVPDQKCDQGHTTDKCDPCPNIS